MSSAPGSRLPSTQPVNLRVFAVALLVLLALLLSGRELAGPRSASAAPQQGKSPIVAAQIPGQQGSPTSIPASNASVVPGTVSVALESAPGDPVGGGTGTLSFAGNGTLDYEHNRIVINMVQTVPPFDDWSFQFAADSLQFAATYTQAAEYPGSGGHPGLAVTKTGTDCANLTGQFSIEQQQPALVISFVQHCDQSDARTLQGTITFLPVPDDIATARPDATYRPTASSMQSSLDLNYDPNQSSGPATAASYHALELAEVAPKPGGGDVALTQADSPDVTFVLDFAHSPAIQFGEFYSISSPATTLFVGRPTDSRICPSNRGFFRVMRPSQNGIVIDFRFQCGIRQQPLTGTVHLGNVNGSQFIRVPHHVENAFQPASFEGVLTAELRGSPGEPLTKGQPSVKLYGPGTAHYQDNIVTITSQGWTFRFYADFWESGYVYQYAPRIGSAESRYPAMDIKSPDKSCATSIGSFSAKSVQQQFTISFTFLCEKHSDWNLEGTLVLVP